MIEISKKYSGKYLFTLLFLLSYIALAQESKPYYTSALYLAAKAKTPAQITHSEGFYKPNMSWAPEFAFGYHREVFKYKKWSLHAKVYMELYSPIAYRFTLKEEDIEDYSSVTSKYLNVLWFYPLNGEYEIQYQLLKNKAGNHLSLLIGHRMFNLFRTKQNYSSNLGTIYDKDMNLIYSVIFIPVEVESPKEQIHHSLMIGGAYDVYTKWSRLQLQLKYNHGINKLYNGTYKYTNLKYDKGSKGRFEDYGHEVTLSLSIFPAWGKRRKKIERYKK
ncbi:MAG: hypothetical protein N4A45_04700 [Flavobacteriales bacterium]|jgi:hypothetical protein|nr:hypothetical protein [Flavobacteriales bacterium]